MLHPVPPELRCDQSLGGHHGRSRLQHLGESAVLHEKLLSKAHDSLIRGLEEDLRVGIGMDGKLSALAILADFPLKKEVPMVEGVAVGG